MFFFKKKKDKRFHNKSASTTVYLSCPITPFCETQTKCTVHNTRNTKTSLSVCCIRANAMHDRQICWLEWKKTCIDRHLKDDAATTLSSSFIPVCFRFRRAFCIFCLIITVRTSITALAYQNPSNNSPISFREWRIPTPSNSVFHRDFWWAGRRIPVKITNKINEYHQLHQFKVNWMQ